MNKYPSFSEWSKNTDIIKRASEFAKIAHKGITRKFDKTPYFNHVERVANKVSEFTKDKYMIAAAYLHDTIEDVDGITRDVIEDIFGTRVADLVWELTSDEMLTNADKTSYLTSKMIKMSGQALLIKLCDRLDNCSDFPTADEKFVDKYAASTNEILNNLEKSRNLSSSHRRIIEKIRYYSNGNY